MRLTENNKSSMLSADISPSGISATINLTTTLADSICRCKSAWRRLNSLRLSMAALRSCNKLCISLSRAWVSMINSATTSNCCSFSLKKARSASIFTSKALASLEIRSYSSWSISRLKVDARPNKIKPSSTASSKACILGICDSISTSC